MAQFAARPGGERTVDTREQYSERAAQLRKALDIINDPLARRLLTLTIESLEDAAEPAQQLTLSEPSPQHLKDAS
jgi:hypothetical protein